MKTVFWTTAVYNSRASKWCQTWTPEGKRGCRKGVMVGLFLFPFFPRFSSLLTRPAAFPLHIHPVPIPAMVRSALSAEPFPVSALKPNFRAALSGCLFFFFPSFPLGFVLLFMLSFFFENRSDKGHFLLEWKRTVIWQGDIPSLPHIRNVDISSFKTETIDKNCPSNSTASSYLPKNEYLQWCLWLLLNFRMPLLKRL